MSGAAPHVVVVHGLWMQGTESLLLRRRLDAAGYQTRVFRYRSVAQGLRANALKLAEFLATFSGTVHLVGHSLGGVLILETLAQHAVACNGRVVCLGSPLLGSRTAAVLATWPGGSWFIGRSMHDLLERSGFGACGSAREVGIIAGDHSFGVGRLVRGLQLPNDGTVSVAETQLAGATDHIVVRAAHFSLLWSSEAIRQVLCFLERGRFCHASFASRASS